MRSPVCTVLVLATISIAGCARSSPTEPDRASPAVAASKPGEPTTTAATGKPEIDPTYANGTTVYMIGPHLIVNAKATMPNAYEHAEELYLLVYPQTAPPQPGAGPITLPSGYQPQCDPCFHCRRSLSTTTMSSPVHPAWALTGRPVNTKPRGK